MKKIILLTISIIVIITASVHPAKAFALDSTLIGLTNPVSTQSFIADLLFPGLVWTEIRESVAVDFVTGANSETISAKGTAFRSSSFQGKPSSGLFEFYYINHMQALGWQYVGFINNSFLMEIQYYSPEIDRGLDVKMGKCNLLDASNLLGDQFCVQLWISSSAIEPPPIMQTLTEVLIPSQTAATDSSKAFVYCNPLPVPFYSQRAFDPNGSLFVGYGNCSFTLYDVGCTVAAYAMIYSYFQANFTDPLRLNEALKVTPGVFSLYQSGCYIYWPDFINLPDAPAGVSGSSRVYNACQTASCLDEANSTLIDSELKLGHPIHARVHWAGQDKDYHSVVIIGHAGSNYYIHDPLALDSSVRTLSSGEEGEYIVDYLFLTHGNPPVDSVTSRNSAANTDKVAITSVYCSQRSRALLK